MIDVSQEFQRASDRKRLNEFVENVLNRVNNKDLANLDIDDLDNMSEEEIEKMYLKMGGSLADLNTDGSDALGGFGEDINNLLNNLDSGKLSEEEEAKKREFEEKYGFEDGWWLKKDSKGNPIKPAFESDDFFRNIAVAPYYLIKFTYGSINRRSNDNKPDLGKYFNELFKVSCATAIIALIGWLIYNLNFIVSMPTLLLISVILAVASKIYIIKTTPEVENETIEEPYESMLDEEQTEDTYENIEEEYLDEVVAYDVEEEEEEEEEENDIEIIKKEYSENLPLKEYLVPPKIDEEGFNDILKNSLEKCKKLRNIDYTVRENIVKSLNPFIFCNNPGFSEMKTVSRSSLVYKNTAFLIYEGLTKVINVLDYSGNYTMEIVSFMETQIYYRVQFSIHGVKIKANQITSANNMSEIKSAFKSNDADNNVSISVTSSRNDFTFKIAKASNTVVTWGDAIRNYNTYENKGAYDQFVSEKYGFPIMIGLQNEETPFIFDAEENTNIMIAGQTGSGKSWAIYDFIFNIAIQAHPGDAQFIILDMKEDPQYKTIAMLPHVLGIHTDPLQFSDILREVNEEMIRRKNIGIKLNVSKWSDIRGKVKDDPDTLHQLPWLYVIIEETASVLNTLEDCSKKGKELRDEFINIVSTIAKQCRAYGIRIVIISQRTTDKDIPKTITSQCGVKWTFKLSQKELELIEMYSSEVSLPDKTGMSLFSSVKETNSSPIAIKSLGIGGMNDRQILNLTRMLAIEWHSRITDAEAFLRLPSFKITDNRVSRREEVLRDIQNGDYFAQILDGNKIKDVLDDVNDELYGGNTSYTNEIPDMRNVTGEGFKVDLDKEIKQKHNSNSKNKLVTMPNGYLDENDGEYRVPEIKSTGNKVRVKDGIPQSNLDRTGGISPTSKAITPMWGGARLSNNGSEDDENKIYNENEDSNINDGEIPINENLNFDDDVDENINTDMYKSYNPTSNLKKKISVSQFILENGEGNHHNMMLREEVEKYYSRSEIKEALDNIEIVEDEEYYRA